MGKLFSFRYALLLSILLLSISSYRFIRDVDTVNPEYDMPNAAIDSVNESSFVFNPSFIHNDKTLNALGTTITLGESAESILDKLGSPKRIAKTEMDFDYYVYNNNYSKLLLVAIKENKVVGYYTDSIDFNYLDITSGCSLKKVNQSLNTDLSVDYILTNITENHTLHIFMDDIGSHTVTGISLLISDVKEIGYTEDVKRDIELLIYDLTNSIRKRNGIPILSWSSTAAKAAQKHSIDMAENAYFDHYSLYNKTPGDRLKEEGIYYQSIGENIIAGYENAIVCSHAWFNSPEHRDNILNKNYRSLGVGFTYLEDSIYKTYITQNFFR
ncbi:MAG: CAP domain-containing protein [Herbinix sp.]|nr:CAP domain-containing protein [Herbinix sp.]